MAVVTFRSPALPGLIAKWQDKRAQVPIVARIGAEAIAEATNNSLLAQAFPGRIPKTVHAEVGPTSGAQLASVVGVVDQPLFWWYTKGTNVWAGKGFKDIYPVRAKALHFFWRNRGGEEVWFQHVSNPGTPPHQFEFDKFMALLMAEAEETWTTLLRDLLME